MPKPSTIDLYGDHLWDDLEKIEGITEKQKLQILRYRSVVMIKLKDPAITNTQLVRIMNRMFGIKGAQAYRDIAECEPFLATIKLSQTEYLRYMVTESQKEAVAMAKRNNDPDGISRANAVIVKANRLDQEQAQRIPYEDIVPPPIEFVNDPTVLGLPEVPDQDEYIEKMKRKYLFEPAVIVEDKG